MTAALGSSPVADAVGPSAGLAPAGTVRHLYVHVPFCGHRCGYCDFVTVVGHEGSQRRYVEALLTERARVEAVLAPRLETVYLGGGTPTMLEPEVLELLLRGLPRAGETTVEANPETVTAKLAALLRGLGVNRVSLGAQSFQPRLLDVLERRARPETVRGAFTTLREAGIENLSLDLIYGVPGQTPDDLERDLDEAIALGPDHLSCYELEAKPGTRFTHAHGRELGRQAEAMEGYFERVVERLTAAGYRWYETANFCREGKEARHNLATWLGRDSVGVGIGAVSTVGGLRWRNRPGLTAYCDAIERGEEPSRELEPLARRVRLVEQLALALRLDRPVDLGPFGEILDPAGVERMRKLGLLEREGGRIRLTRRGRLLGGGVTVELLADDAV